MNEFETGPDRSPGREEPLVKELCLPLWQAKGWLKLVGVLSIVHGILLAITLVGLLVCWLPIWMGVLLLKAAGAVEVAQISGDKLQLIEAQNRLKTYFTICGVLVLISLVALTVFFVMGLAGGGGLLGYLSALR